jgi:hypothetical protein
MGIRRHSSIIDVQSFRGADCETYNYLVVAKVRERLAVSKRAAQKIDKETCNMKNTKEGGVKEEYQVTIRKFCSSGKLEDSGHVNKAWDNTRENI